MAGFNKRDRAKVVEKVPGLEYLYGKVCKVEERWANSVYVSHAELRKKGISATRFDASSLRNVTQRPKEEDTRPLGEVIRENRRKPKKRVRRIT